jgi:hypothetical protein
VVEILWDSSRFCMSFRRSVCQVQYQRPDMKVFWSCQTSRFSCRVSGLLGSWLSAGNHRIPSGLGGCQVFKAGKSWQTGGSSDARRGS